MFDAADSVLLARLKAGADPAAAQAVWERYFDRLAVLAHRRLTDHARRVADGEDVALSVFDSFFRGAASGRFPRLDDRDDLWQILVMLTERKAIDLVRRATADKRGGGAVRGDSVFARPDDSAAGPGFDRVIDGTPDPEFAVLFADECQRLLGRLGDSDLARLAVLKLEGYTNEEAAEQLGRSLRSVQRKLETIRRVWDQAAADRD